MSFASPTTVKVKVVNYSNSPRIGVNVVLNNPFTVTNEFNKNPSVGSTSQSAVTDTAGVVLFSGVNAGNYNISVSGVGTSYIVKNTYIPNPDTLPFENRTFVMSNQAVSGAGIEALNWLVGNNGSISGTTLTVAPNPATDYQGGVQIARTKTTTYDPYTNSIIVWSGTNVGKQSNNTYYHQNQTVQAFQFTQLVVNI